MLVNAVMNLRFHKMREISGLAEDLLASPVVLCSMELVKKFNICGSEHHAL